MTAESASSVHKRTGRVAAIVLAAGEAKRMGSPKALLPWQGQTLLRHCALTALASRCDEVLVALGSNASELKTELADLEVRSFEHSAWQTGMGSTLAAATQQLDVDLDGIVVLLCDQPFVSSDLIDTLIQSASGREMAACAYRDTLGPPAYFSRSQFPCLRDLSGDRGAKALLLEHRESIATVPFPEGRFDIDEPDDYDRALQELSRQSARQNEK